MKSLQQFISESSVTEKKVAKTGLMFNKKDYESFKAFIKDETDSDDDFKYDDIIIKDFGKVRGNEKMFEVTVDHDMMNDFFGDNWSLIGKPGTPGIDGDWPSVVMS